MLHSRKCRSCRNATSDNSSVYQHYFLKTKARHELTLLNFGRGQFTPQAIHTKDNSYHRQAILPKDKLCRIFLFCSNNTMNFTCRLIVYVKLRKVCVNVFVCITSPARTIYSGSATLAEVTERRMKAVVALLHFWRLTRIQFTLVINGDVGNYLESVKKNNLFA